MVVWLVSGFILEMSYQVFSAGIRIKNQTRYMPFIVGMGAGFNVIANFWVLPRWGMVGAGFTTFCANGVLVVLAYHYSNRFFPVPYEWDRLTRIGGLFAALVIADALWSPTRLFTAIPLKVLGLLAFPVGLWFMGVISSKELRSLREVAESFARKPGKKLRLDRAVDSTAKLD